MYTFGTIDLTDNATWINEFEGSKIQHTVKTTEDGRVFDFQKKRQKREAPIILKCELSYETCLQLAALRDSGNVDSLMLADGRVFNAILTNIDAAPFFEDTAVFAGESFFVKLSFMEV